jgi:hydrogenase expression/formation protein HypE
VNGDKILLEHGSGGELTNKLINNLFLSVYSASAGPGSSAKHLKQTDSAVLETGSNLISFTTDSYVIKPIFFPGGDIGKLSVCGTVNDLSVSGSVPEYISVSFIIEEGFPLNDLKTIVNSQAEAALESGVKVVCGDTKVVEKGACDGVFINTSGIGRLSEKQKGISTAEGIEVGDILLVSGFVGSHGTAVLSARENLPFSSDIISDCAPLSGMIQTLLKEVPDIVFMRDATRGGIATVLTEFAELTGMGILIEEDKIPVDEQVKALTGILGLDPLYLANEGTIIIAAKKGTEDKAVSVLRNTRYGKNCAVIGEIVNNHPEKAVIKTEIGGRRFLYRLSGEQLPRIC